MQIHKQQRELFSENDYSTSKFSRNNWIHNTLATLVERLNEPLLEKTDIIRWGCPVPSFGDLSNSKIATLGLNPSNKEFVDKTGKELNGVSRRFHTLNSLDLDCWSKVEDYHLDLINFSCKEYFSRNPYDTWFKKLDYLISETNTSFYSSVESACHLDLIPYATSCKWTELNRTQRQSLMTAVGDTLGLLIKDSPVNVLILNGRSVVNNLESITEIELKQELMPDWELPRKTSGIKGIAYKGLVSKISGVNLNRQILVLGFNHNIQSSFGVTKQVINSIKKWLGKEINKKEHL